jgi:starch-binding outer membrane protein, SusD/RagB family
MKLLKFLTLFVALFTLTNCEDLELNPITSETSATAYDEPIEIEAALISVYNAFGGGTGNGHIEYYQWDVLNFQDTRADNSYAGGDVPEIFAVDFLNIVPTNSRLSWHWGAFYSAINKANNVLERAPLIKDEKFRASRLDQVMGEAYFLRAYHYYHLVTMFSGVPLVTKTTTSIKPADINIPRSTSVQVYAQILSDLEKAIKLLPDTFANNVETKTRATSGAANALAAKANLQKPNPDFQASLDHILALEKSKANYRLLNDYDKLFDGSAENNSESILEVQFDGVIHGTFRPSILLPPSRSIQSWRKFVTPSNDLINLYLDEGDVNRLSSTILFENVNWIDEYWGNQQGSSVPFVYKYRNAVGWDQSATNNYLIRYGDILLLKAEALNGLNRLNEAVTEVNKIRARAKLSNLTAQQRSSKEALKLSILKERRLELAFEGERWNDLVRNGLAVSTMNALKERDLRTGQLVNYNMTTEKLFLPIPQTEMDLNRSLSQGLL